MSQTSRKTILSLLGALTLGLLFAGCGREPASRGRVVLIGLDGASWNLLDPMVKAGELPHFKTLMERGVSADLASVPPFLSPAVWTSIATSRRPADHGVLYFYSNRLPRYAYAVVDVGGPEDIIANSERELRDKPRYWNRLWDELQPDVGAVTFYALDVLSHRFWHTLADDGSPRLPGLPACRTRRTVRPESGKTPRPERSCAPWATSSKRNGERGRAPRWKNGWPRNKCLALLPGGRFSAAEAKQIRSFLHI